jgi:catechol 2,3-dioxygenase-like lactoylglutathione lyase family enzyme
LSIDIVEINHVNVVVPKHLEEATKHFYASTLGLREIPKPPESRHRGGAWYQVGAVQLHLSIRPDNGNSRPGHVCYTVADADAAAQDLIAAGIEIIPDERPIAGQPRFYVRDPGGNLIEIAQKSH